MGVLKDFLNKFKNNIINYHIVKLLSGLSPTFQKVSGKLEDNIVARESIDTIATNIAKMTPRHYQQKKNGKVLVNGDINRLLSLRPNPYMSSYDFWYKIGSFYYSQNNAYILQDIDDKGFLIGLYPINPLFATLVTDGYELWLKFQFYDGNTYYIKYSEIIHLRRFYNEHEFYGDSNDILKSKLETQAIVDDGIKNAIKISTSLRGILKASNSMLKQKDLNNIKDEFVESILSSSKGIGSLDSKFDFQEVNLNPVLLDKDQMERVDGNVYRYFRLSEKIVSSTFNEDEWNAFYESVLEPFAIQASQELTYKIFNDKAIDSGNLVYFDVNRLKYASTKTKNEVIKESGSLGMITVDEGREILDLPPIGGEEGSKRLQTLNVINQDIADQYQGGKKKGKEDTGNTTNGNESSTK